MKRIGILTGRSDVPVEGAPKLGGVGEQVASQIQQHCGVQARTTVLGHL